MVIFLRDVAGWLFAAWFFLIGCLRTAVSICGDLRGYDENRAQFMEQGFRHAGAGCRGGREA